MESHDYKGSSVGYSINYIRADDVSTYFNTFGGARPPPTATARGEQFPLVVPFIIRPVQAARDPYTGALPPGRTMASQRYIAAGNLFQPHGIPGAPPAYAGDAYGSYEWFNDVYRAHMTFTPGDLITVGAIRNDSATTRQNCQVTVYIKLDQP